MQNAFVSDNEVSSNLEDMKQSGTAYYSPLQQHAVAEAFFIEK